MLECVFIMTQVTDDVKQFAFVHQFMLFHHLHLPIHNENLSSICPPSCEIK